MKITKRRGALLLFWGVAVFYAANSMGNAFSVNYRAFDRGASKLLERSREIKERAASFSKERILRDLAASEQDGFCFRFDDNAGEAVHHALFSEGGEAFFAPGGGSFEFDDEDEVPLRPAGGRFQIGKGILKYTHDENNALTNVSPLEIARDGIDHVDLRFKVGASKKVLLGWNSVADKNAVKEYAEIDVVPGGGFHTYRIYGELLAAGIFERKKPLMNLVLLPEAGDEVEIDYIRLGSRMDAYAARPYGATDESLHGERRKSLYVRAGHQLDYRLSIPPGPAFLKFGLGALKKEPLGVEIRVRSSKAEETVFAGEIGSLDGWIDHRIDVSAYAGENVTISFAVRGREAHVAFFGNPVLFVAPLKRNNFIVVVEDALRADHMSGYGYEMRTTPNKDAYAGEGVLFLQAYSQSAFTRSSVSSLLTSMYPSALGIWSQTDRLDEKYLTVAEVLRARGFVTALLSQNPHVGRNSGLERGFGTVLEFDSLGRRAEEIYGSDSLDRWIKANRDRNFFLFLHVIDPHYPFDPPIRQEKKKEDLGGVHPVPLDEKFDPPWLKKATVESRNLLYDWLLSYNDLHFPKLLRTLRRYDLYDDTLVIFTSDHGEHLGEHGLWDHGPPHYRQTLQVPLIMVYPNKFPPRRRIGESVQLLDLVPTIMDIAEIDMSQFTFEGESLLPLIDGSDKAHWQERVCISDALRYRQKNERTPYGSILYKNLHIILSGDLQNQRSQAAGRAGRSLGRGLFGTGVFDLNRDPGEYSSQLLYGIDYFFTRKVNGFFREIRGNHLDIQSAVSGEGAQAIEVNRETKDRLKSLGYSQ